MRKLSITVSSVNEFYIKITEHNREYSLDGVAIDFFFGKNLHEKEMLHIATEIIKHNFHWIKIEGSTYSVNLTELATSYNELFSECPWMKGNIVIVPSFENGIDEGVKVLSLTATKEEIINMQPKKIFLSHKGANKPKVRKFYALLKELGYEPWLDEEDMAAGKKLHRGILEGFDESCAVVFFITPEFKDEFHLENEIDFAIDASTERKNFRIITLQFENETGEKGVIPSLLKRYVWKQPQSDLEAFKEIIKALPIKLGTPPVWK